jgi:hypothetical protein
MKWCHCLVAALALGGCDSLPRDAEGTLDRVEAGRQFRVGLIADGGDGRALAAARAFVARVSQATQARPELRTGASEPLLLDLENGRLDLVVGVLAEQSPWTSEVAILQPLAEVRAPERLLVTPIARNGENRWIMLLEREAETLAPGLDR